MDNITVSFLIITLICWGMALYHFFGINEMKCFWYGFTAFWLTTVTIELNHASKCSQKLPEKRIAMYQLCPTCKQPLHNSDDYFFPSTANTNAVHTTH